VTADDVIALLHLKPHPEGGFYCETFRDLKGAAGRAHSTAIYYLLRRGEQSRWHRVDAAEIWHWYQGDALELAISGPAGLKRHLLGPRLEENERPQAVVPAQHWQSARSLGGYTLLGCTVAPGFEFAGFEVAPKDWSPG
jgi:predicted cupin superfamily sugar epimerase